MPFSVIFAFGYDTFGHLAASGGSLVANQNSRILMPFSAIFALGYDTFGLSKVWVREFWPFRPFSALGYESFGVSKVSLGRRACFVRFLAANSLVP